MSRFTSTSSSVSILMSTYDSPFPPFSPPPSTSPTLQINFTYSIFSTSFFFFFCSIFVSASSSTFISSSFQLSFHFQTINFTRSLIFFASFFLISVSITSSTFIATSKSTFTSDLSSSVSSYFLCLPFFLNDYLHLHL